MKTTCDLVAERVALGEPLGDAADHAAQCPRCRRLAALPAELGATHREVEPGLGFAARMTAGAQQLVVVRRRRRVAVALAAAVATGLLGVFALTRQAPASQVASAPAAEPRPTTNPPPVEHDHVIDPDVAALVRFADVDRASRLSARWARIEKPLAPYRVLLEGVKP